MLIRASMGPRHLSRGIWLRAVPDAVEQTASMGPRHLSRGIFGAAKDRIILESASMGPRHLSRGIRIRGRQDNRALRSFNGATASEPWNPQRRDGARADYPRFNGATASEPWNRNTRHSCSERLSICFNGATASEPWNQPEVRNGFHARIAASMGPRHLSRGIVMRISLDNKRNV